MRTWTAATGSPEETRALGRLLGEAISAPVNIFLTGDLGAGKTCLTQGLALGLGVPEREPVTSPSYTLMNQYPGRLDLFHFDLYRLSGPEDLLELGFEDYLHGEGVAVLEWAEPVSEQDLDGIRVRIDYGSQECREFTFDARGAAARRILRELAGRWEAERGEA